MEQPNDQIESPVERFLRFSNVNTKDLSPEGMIIHGIALLIGRFPADLVGDVEAFHVRYGIQYSGPPRDLDEKLKKFRVDRLQDEMREYLLGVSSKNLAEQLDGLVDLVYIAIGTAHLHGWNFREAWRRVHAANMSKELANKSNPGKFGHVADIVKPPGWVAPSMKGLV